MRTRQQIIQAMNDNSSTVYDRQMIVELLLDIRDLLSERTTASRGVVEYCDNCKNDNHDECTGCRCHADY